MNWKFTVIKLSFLFFAFISCKPNEIIENNNLIFKKDQGIFIINEGLFNQANSSVYYYNFDQDSLYSDIFQNTNNEKIGDILQNMYISDKTGYLVVNNSGLIRKVNLDDFKQLTVATGFKSPRQFFKINNSKAYISDIFSNSINIYSLTEDKITGEIKTGRWTENFALYGDKVYVTCPWNYSKPVSKLVYEIDSKNDKLADSIITGKNPSNIVIDKNGYMWILCAGNSYEGIKGSLFKTDLKTKQNVDSIHFDQVLNIFNTGMQLNETRDTLYVMYNDIIKIPVAGKIAPETIIKRNNENFYGFGINNKRQLLYIADALNFSSKGKVYIYTKKGKLIKTVSAGFLPNNVIPY